MRVQVPDWPSNITNTLSDETLNQGVTVLYIEHVKEPGVTSDGFRPLSCTIPRNKKKKKITAFSGRRPYGQPVVTINANSVNQNVLAL